MVSLHSDGKLHINLLLCGTENSGYGASGQGILRALDGSKIVPHDDACEVGVAYMPLDLNPLEELPNPVKILYTMFEATRWPDSYVSACNCAHEVWVPSKWCKDTLRASGCDRPIRIIPLGFDPQAYFPEKRKKHDAFIIGYSGAANGRKGFGLFLKAFTQEFSPQDNVLASIHTSAYLTSDLPTDPRISISDEVYSLKQMRDFYHSCDLIVLPSHGEGFGLTPLEAAACGTPVAITDYGGCKDYIADDVLRISAGIEPCPDYRSCYGYWASPSVESIRYCMRWAYENQAQAKELGRAAAKRVHSSWAFEHTVQAMAIALCQVNVNERIPLEREKTVSWKGDPMRVTTSIGRFTRGEVRTLTDEQIAKLNPSDVHPKGFHIEFRYKRSAPAADS